MLKKSPIHPLVSICDHYVKNVICTHSITHMLLIKDSYKTSSYYNHTEKHYDFLHGFPLLLKWGKKRKRNRTSNSCMPSCLINIQVRIYNLFSVTAFAMQSKSWIVMLDIIHNIALYLTIKE